MDPSHNKLSIYCKHHTGGTIQPLHNVCSKHTLMGAGDYWFFFQTIYVGSWTHAKEMIRPWDDLARCYFQVNQEAAEVVTITA